MSDIVERLRDAARFLDELEGFPELQTEAADEITRLREALKPFSEWSIEKYEGSDPAILELVSDLRAAATAIREGSPSQ